MRKEHVDALNELINARYTTRYTTDKNDDLDMLMALANDGDFYILKCVDNYYGITELSYPHFIGFLKTTSYRKLPSYDINEYFYKCSKKMRPCIVVIGSSRNFNLVNIRRMDALDFDILPDYFMEEIFGI